MVSSLFSRSLVWIGTAAIALSLTQYVPPRPIADGTIQGRFTVSVCIGPQRAGSTCRPAWPQRRTAIRFVPVDGGPATAAMTDGDGSYSARVAPGTYTVDVPMLPSLTEPEITVGPGETRTADLFSYLHAG